MLSLFASTLFLTSALIFALEPLVAKGLLPVLGGGAAVWTTAVAFFQLALFVGYLYAHLAPTWLGARRHAFIHVALLIVVAVGLPLASPMDWHAPGEHQALWLFGRLAISIGPVFVLLAATAPLVQRWFAATAHRDARDPYFLYAASNAGSLTALLAYPILLEPLVGLTRQRRWWTVGLAVAVVLLGVCAAMAKRHAAVLRGPGQPEAAPGPISGPSWASRARWLVLAAVPSSLLLSVTSYMTTDLVALPLLWVMPLALYLLSFILAFAPRALISPRRAIWLQALVLVPLTVQLSLRTGTVGWNVLPAHALVFFVTALVCHQTLAGSRPGAAHATEFYLWVAAGGALGGLFSVLAAPVLFSELVEYPIGVVLAALLRPGAPDEQSLEGQGEVRADRRNPWARRFDFLWPAALTVTLLIGVRVAHAVELRFGDTKGLVVLGVVLAGAGVAGYSFRFRPTRFGLGLAAILVAGGTYSSGLTRTLYATRSFYGTLRIQLAPPTMMMLAHGETLHGAQNLARRREPLSYYSRLGPVGDLMTAWQGRPQRQRVGVVGLGAGTMAAYAEPGERWTFFEINPAVQEIARDRGFFTFLRDARAPVDIVLGDARLSIAATADGTFGFLVLDAFSSDAIPVHLLTREAMALYARKLSPGGLLAVHISNRFLDLEPVVAVGAAAVGFRGMVRFDGVTAARGKALETSSAWMVLARSPADLAPLARDPRWKATRANGQGWTDDASNLWGALNLSGG